MKEKFVIQLKLLYTPLMVGRDGVEPPESEDNRFTVYPAPTYGISTHIFYSLSRCQASFRFVLSALRLEQYTGFEPVPPACGIEYQT